MKKTIQTAKNPRNTLSIPQTPVWKYVQLHSLAITIKTSLILSLLVLTAPSLAASEGYVAVSASATFRICYLPESSLEGTVAAVHILSAADNMNSTLSAIRGGGSTSTNRQHLELVSSVLDKCTIAPLGVASSTTTPTLTTSAPSSSASSCRVEVKVLEVRGNTAPRDIVEAVLGDPNCSIVIGLPSISSKLAAVFPAASQPWIAAPVTTSGSVVGKEYLDSVLYPWFNSVGTSQEALGVGAAELFKTLGWSAAHVVKFSGFDGAALKSVYTLPEPYMGPLTGLGNIADNAAFFASFNGAFSIHNGTVASTTDFKISINSTFLISSNLSTRILLEQYIRPTVQAIKKRRSASKLVLLGIGVSPEDATNALCHIAYFTCTSEYITKALDTYYQAWRDVLIEEGMHTSFVLVFSPNFPTVYLPPGAFQIAVRSPVENYKSWWYTEQCNSSSTVTSSDTAPPSSASSAAASLEHLNISHASMASLNQVQNMTCGALLEVVGAYRLAVSMDAFVASLAAIGSILSTTPTTLEGGLFAADVNHTSRAKGHALLHAALRSDLDDVPGFSGSSLGMVTKSGVRKVQELRVLHMPTPSTLVRSIINPFNLLQISTSETGASVAYTISLVGNTSDVDNTTSTNVTVSRASSVINWFADASIVSPTAPVPDVNPDALLVDPIDFVQLIVLIIVLIVAFIFVVSGVLLLLYIRQNPDAIRTISSSISSNNVSGPLTLLVALVADVVFTVFVAEGVLIPVFLGIAVLVSIFEFSQWIWRRCTNHQSTTNRVFGIASMFVELSVPSLLLQNIPFGAFTSLALLDRTTSSPTYILPCFIISLLLVGYRGMRFWDLLEHIPWLSLCITNANQTEAGYMLEDSDGEGEEDEEDEEGVDDHSDSDGDNLYAGESIHAIPSTGPLATPGGMTSLTAPTESILSPSHFATETSLKVGGLSSFAPFQVSPRENSEGPRSCTSDTPKQNWTVTSDPAITPRPHPRRRERSVSILSDPSVVTSNNQNRRRRVFRPKEDDNKSAWLSILKNALFPVDVEDAVGFTPGLLTPESQATASPKSTTDPLHGGDHELLSLAGSKSSFVASGLHQFDRMCVSRSTFASFIYRTDPGRYKELTDFTDTLCLTLRVQHDVLTSELQSVLLPLMRLSAMQDGNNKFTVRDTSVSWQKLHDQLLSLYQHQISSGLPSPVNEDDKPTLTSLRVLRGVLQFTATGLREGSRSLLDTVANYNSAETASFWNPFSTTAPTVCAFSERGILTTMASQDVMVEGDGLAGASSTMSPPLPSPQHRDALEKDPERSSVCSVLSIHSHFPESLNGDNKRPVIRNHPVDADSDIADGNDDTNTASNDNSATKDVSVDVDVAVEDVHGSTDEDLFAIYMQNEEIRMLLDWKIHLQHFTSDAKKANGGDTGGASNSFVPSCAGGDSHIEVASKQRKPSTSIPHHIQLGFTDLSTLSPADVDSSDVLNLIAFGKMASAMSLLAYQWDTLKTTATGGNDPTVEEVADLLKTAKDATSGEGAGGFGSMAINKADRKSFMDRSETDEQINATAKLFVKGMKIALKENKFRLYLEHLKESLAFQHAQERHKKRKAVKSRLLNCFKVVTGLRNPLLMMARAAGRGAPPAKSLVSMMGKGDFVHSTTANPLTILPTVRDCVVEENNKGNVYPDNRAQPPQ